MATIGTFKKSGNEFVGQIVTLSVQAKNVRIVPEANRSGENAPSHRVFAVRASPPRSTPTSSTTRTATATA
jgi:uncharacterized protein (DUF736 family)